ncbi:hypothetical protein [Lewinella sp. IMCC34191]|uniref:hypothetical protein n=1 Tax=Lewinella sp. IMCC34191 TaxID=2259172 RepID=UPI000E271A36|nr:hypothetical protein [Lewinella sp. IMCC34191]
MVLWFLGLCGLVQLAFYALAAGREGSSAKRHATCAAMVVMHAVVFPPYFMPEITAAGCGMPVLLTYVTFWIFGIGSTVFIHLLTAIILRACRG